MTPSLLYPRALALGALLFAAGACVWTAGAWLGVASWWYPTLLWALAALCGLVCFGAMRVYREVQHVARARERGTQRLLGGLRGTSVVRVYDPPSVEEIAAEWARIAEYPLVPPLGAPVACPECGVTAGFSGDVATFVAHLGTCSRSVMRSGGLRLVDGEAS